MKFKILLLFIVINFTIAHTQTPVTWKDVVGATTSGNSITCTVGGWGNSGAASNEMIPANTSGYVEATVGTLPNGNSTMMIGLSPTNVNANYETIHYNLYCYTNIEIWESGTNRTYNAGSYTLGDVFRVERVGTTIYYKKNGTTIWTSTVPSSTSLLVDIAMYQTGSTWQNVVLQGGSTSSPAIPTGVTATPTSISAISVGWTAVAGATSYAIDQALNSTFTTGLQTFTSASNSYSASGLTASTTYYYRVRAVNSAGTSGNSSVVNATTQSGVTVPGIPTGVTTSATSSSAISVSWTAVSGATSYAIDQALNNTFTSGLQTFTAATNSYSATGLTASTTYYYRVRAVNSAGASGNSAVAQATTQSGVTVPGIPTGLAATPTSSSAISVSWTAVAGATSYQIDQSTNSSFSGATTFTPTSSSYSASGLTASTIYYYRVRAVNSAGTSGNSSIVQATTSASGSVSSQWTTSGAGIYHMNPVHIGKANTNTGAESGYSLYVANGIKAEKFKLEIGSAGGWADYVFDKNYTVMPIRRLKEYIAKNRHLPGFPSEKKIIENHGYEMGDMVKKQQEALENLHLYVIQLEQKILELEKKLLNSDIK